MVLGHFQCHLILGSGVTVKWISSPKNRRNAPLVQDTLCLSDDGRALRYSAHTVSNYERKCSSGKNRKKHPSRGSSAVSRA